MSEIFLSFQDVNFPTVIVCNINQIRRSLFRGLGVTNESDIELLYSQFYTGMSRNLTQDEQDFIHKIATSEVWDKKIPSIVFFLKGTSEFVLVFTYPFVEIQYLSSHTGIQQEVLKYLLRRPLAKNSTNCKINIGKQVHKM